MFPDNLSHYPRSSLHFRSSGFGWSPSPVTQELTRSPITSHHGELSWLHDGWKYRANSGSWCDHPALVFLLRWCRPVVLSGALWTCRDWVFSYLICCDLHHPTFCLTIKKCFHSVARSALILACPYREQYFSLFLQWEFFQCLLISSVNVHFLPLLEQLFLGETEEGGKSFSQLRPPVIKDKWAREKPAVVYWHVCLRDHGVETPESEQLPEVS